MEKAKIRINVEDFKKNVSELLNKDEKTKEEKHIEYAENYLDLIQMVLAEHPRFNQQENLYISDVIIGKIASTADGAIIVFIDDNSVTITVKFYVSGSFTIRNDTYYYDEVAINKLLEPYAVSVESNTEHATITLDRKKLAERYYPESKSTIAELIIQQKKDS